MSKKKAVATLVFEEIDFALGPYVSLEAKITGDDDVPTGIVSFRKGSCVMGNSTLKDGKATLKYSGFREGVHELFVEYGGDHNYLTTTSESINYTPSRPTITKPQSSPFGTGSTPPVNITADKQMVEFMVDLSGGVPAPPATNPTNANHLVYTRKINMTGVGTDLRHGYKFKLPGDDARKVYYAYKEFLQVLSGGFNA